MPKIYCDTCGSNSVKKDSGCYENNVIWCNICKCHRYLTFYPKTIKIT